MARIKGQWITTSGLETHNFDLPYIRPLTLLLALSLLVGIIGGVLSWTGNRST